MSIPNALLSLLTEGPQAASQVQSTFQARTDNAWPLNIGQVTQRSGAWSATGSSNLPANNAWNPGASASPTRRPQREGSRNNVDGIPVDKPKTERDELTIKIALADPNEIDTIIFTQRAYVMEELRALTRGLAGATPVEKLVAKRRIFECEAELRFLDYVEETHA